MLAGSAERCLKVEGASARGLRFLPGDDEVVDLERRQRPGLGHEPLLHPVRVFFRGGGQQYAGRGERRERIGHRLEGIVAADPSGDGDAAFALLVGDDKQPRFMVEHEGRALRADAHARRRDRRDRRQVKTIAHKTAKPTQPSSGGWVVLALLRRTRAVMTATPSAAAARAQPPVA